MIILDFSGIMHSNIMAQVGFNPDPGTVVDEALIRHSILNTIRANNRDFRGEYGAMVIALDAKEYWRKAVFPNYKIRRKKSRDDSPLDWKLIHSTMDKVKGELADNFPYRVVEGNEAEADDVIAELVNVIEEPILILSADQDLIQLHPDVGDRVKQYDPVRKKYLEHASPSTFLTEKIIKGDAGDDVPNVMMPDDTFVTGTRQKPITAKRLEEFQRDLPKGVGGSDHLRNYQRNKMMIDLRNIPSDVRQSIRDSYNKPHNTTKSKLTNYFIKHRLRNLYENQGDF